MGFFDLHGLLLSWLGVLLGPWQSVISYMKRLVQQRVDMIMFPLKERDMIYQAYDRSKGQPFQMHTPDSMITIVSKPEQIRQIATAPNESLSLHAAAKYVLKPQYTMAGFNWHDIRGVEGTGFVRTLRTLLTNHLPKMTPGVRSIMERAFAAEVGKSGTVNALTVSKKVVTDISGFAFFGRDQMENLEFMKAAYRYNEDVLYGAEILRLIPKFLVPVAGKIIPHFFNTQRQVCIGLTELFERRMNSPLSEKYNDVCQWILETSPKDLNGAPKWSADRMAMEVMAVWFGSVQGLATTLTFALYNLCDHPEYIETLRKEVIGPEGAKFLVEGKGLPLMDSFLKECARWTPVESVTSRRAAMQDFTFSDGTVLNKGEWVAVALGPMLRDDSLYPQPNEFDGFRFADPKHSNATTSVQPEGPSKFTDVSEKYQIWGTGKITCPGRFFVSYVMKHVFFHILENYEPSMESKGEKHTLTWRTLSLPRPSINVTFAERAEVKMDG